MMKKGFSVLVLLAISLFLIVSAVSAGDIADDSNAAIEVPSGEQSVDNSDDFTDALDLDNSLEANENSNDSINIILSSNSTNATSNTTSNSTSADSSKVPAKFSSNKNISSTYGKKVKFSVKVINK